MRQRLASFKNSELATAIEAFSALGFHPGNDLVQVSRACKLCHSFQAVRTEDCSGFTPLAKPCSRSQLVK